MMYILTILICYFVVGSFIFKGFTSFWVAQKYFPKAFIVGCKDLYNYIKLKKWKKFDNSGIIMYGGLFGTGKTFNIVDYVNYIYHHYDNIEIYSNVTLTDIPFVPFQYFEQIQEPVVDGMYRIYVCDEFGSLFNSRNYKNSVLTEAQYITVLNQLRKEHKLLLISTQRYGMCDKVFRQVCKEWRECKKIWRFFFYFRFDPYELEYSYDPRIVKPLSIFPHVTFQTEKKRALYNTSEFVQNFDNPIEIIGRTDNGSLVNADYQYSKSAGKRKSK